MAARVIQDGVNELIKVTILEVEKILQSLPQKGDRVDVFTSSGRNECSGDHDSVKANIEKSALLIDQSSSNRFSSKLSAKRSQQKSVSLPKAVAQVLPDSVRVIPMEHMEGMYIDMILELKKEQNSESKQLDIRIECPDFKPSRICIDNCWYNVVW